MYIGQQSPEQNGGQDKENCLAGRRQRENICHLCELWKGYSYYRAGQSNQNGEYLHSVRCCNGLTKLENMAKKGVVTDKIANNVFVNSYNKFLVKF